MNEIDPKLLQRVRDMLTLAEDPATPPEAAEKHTAHAMRLLAKYGIDAAMLHDSGQSRDAVESRLYTASNPYAFEKIALHSHIAEALGCMAVNASTRGDRGVKRLHVTGFTADLDRAEMLYHSLLVQQVRALAAAPGPRPGENTASYKKSFLVAFRSTVFARLKAAEASAKDEAEAAPGRSTDLVLADRHRQVEAAFKAQHPRTRGYRSPASGSGADEGAAAGNRADLGIDTAVDGRRRAITA